MMGLCGGLAAYVSEPEHVAEPIPTGVQRLDPSLDTLVSPDAKVDLVAEGFGFTEGPVWDSDCGCLLFSDLPGNVIYKYSPADGKTNVFMHRAGFQGTDIWRWGGLNCNGRAESDAQYECFPLIGPDGLALDREGRLIIATYAGRSVDRIEKDGTRTVLAEGYGGQRFNGPNDVVVRRDGAIYFTDTFGGLREGDRDRRKQLPYNGVYRWKDGELTLLVSDMPKTNGLAFSPDERNLYVNGSGDNYVRRYDVQPDGTLSNGMLFIDLKGHAEHGATDGMKVDVEGNLYVTGPGGIWVVSPQGRHLGTLRVPEIAINLAFGDADRKSLYVTAHTSVYRIRLKTAGI